MAENEKKLPSAEDVDENNVIPLTDEETGEEINFKFLARVELDGNVYYAITPADEQSEECTILKASEEGEDVVFESIEDDDEYERVEEEFNDIFFNEINYDNN